MIAFLSRVRKSAIGSVILKKFLINNSVESPKEIIGKAEQPDPIQYPGRLKVSFFLWFYADYYILDLDENYRYTVIGSSSDKYLWILSRTPQMDTCLYNKILRGIEQRGYDLSRLVFVKQ